MYDPTVGRFLTEDPIGFKGDPSNPYRYVSNSPTNATDPTGLIEKAYNGCKVNIVVWDADDGIAGDFGQMVANAKASGKVDIDIPIRHGMTNQEIIARIKDTVRQGENQIDSLWFLDHGSTRAFLGQYMGNATLKPEDFEPLGKSFYPRLFTPNAEILFDGCMVGAPVYNSYRQRIANITGARVKASPFMQRVNADHTRLTPFDPARPLAPPDSLYIITEPK